MLEILVNTEQIAALGEQAPFSSALSLILYKKKLMAEIISMKNVETGTYWGSLLTTGRKLVRDSGHMYTIQHHSCRQIEQIMQITVYIDVWKAHFKWHRVCESFTRCLTHI